VKRSKPPVISSKKLPKQGRSRELVRAIHEAAIRVLRDHGARKFTTARVAEAAGVSVGSLYQYFPNKESLLFHMQTEEWRETGATLAAILSEPRPPLDRLRKLVTVFFRSELAERDFRIALHDAGALIRDAPESRVHRAEKTAQIMAFMAEAAPALSAKRRAFVGKFVITALSAIGERITQDPITTSECDAWARETADCLSAYVMSHAA